MKARETTVSRSFASIVTSIASGVICGLFFAMTGEFEHVGSDGAITFSGSWHVWNVQPGQLDWANWPVWVPGLVFGFLFVAAANRGFKVKIARVLLYAMTSSVIYFVALHIFAWTLNSGLAVAEMPRLAAGGFLAGLFGALALALTARLVTGVDFRGVMRTAVLGAGAGVVFVFLMRIPNDRGNEIQAIIGAMSVFIVWPFAFAVWQAAVGWSLAAGLYKSERQEPEEWPAAAPNLPA